MIEVAVLLATIAALLSEAEDVRPQIRALGLGTRAWEPRHRVFFLRFSEDEPHWRTPKKKALKLPVDIDGPMRAFLSLLVDRLGGKVEPVLRFSPHGWEDPANAAHADPDDVMQLLRHVGLDGWVDETQNFLTVDGDGWVVRVEGWGESCVSEGVGPWSIAPGWREPQEDKSCPLPDEQEFLAYCVAEAAVRAQNIAPGETDGPPDDPEDWVLDLWIGALDPNDVYPLVSIQLWRTGRWQKAPDGRLVGFRVARYDPVRNVAVSGADSRQWVSLVPGSIHTMTGRGFFLTNSAQHALDYYAGHDWNALLVYAFDPADHTGGDLTGRDTEISVRRGTLLEFQIYDEDGALWTGEMPPVEPAVDWPVGETVDLRAPGRHAVGQVLSAKTALVELVDELWHDHAWNFWDLDEEEVEEDPATADAEVHRLAAEFVHDLGFDPDGPVFLLASVEIDEADRGQGFDTRFVQQIEAMARNARCAGIFLQAGNMGSGHSHGFWVKMGYVDVPGSRYFDDTVMYKRF